MKFVQDYWLTQDRRQFAQADNLARSGVIIGGFFNHYPGYLTLAPVQLDPPPAVQA